MKNKKKLVKNSLIATHVLFAVIGLCIYLINYNLAESLLLQRTLTQQHTIAKAGSLSIENLLSTAQAELDSFVFSFTTLSDSATVDIASTRQGFRAYLQRSQLPINGISYYDKTGKLAIIEDRQNLHIGENQDFSQTPYMQWSRNPFNRNTLFISTPYIGTSGGSVGKTILILVKPIYFGNTYKGALGIRILVDDLRTAFVSPLVSDTSEDSFILDSNGVIIAGKNNLLNKNLFTYASKQKWNDYTSFISELHSALQGNDTQTTWNFQSPGEIPKTLLVGVSRIDIPNTDKDLYMVVTAPKSNITILLQWLRNYGYIWLGASVLLTIIGSTIVIFMKDTH